MPSLPQINPEFAIDPEVTRRYTAGTFPGWLNFEIHEIGPERAVGRLVVDERHLHRVDYMHAGAWTAFADSVAGWGCARLLPSGGWNFTTAEMKMNMFRTASAGDELWAVGEPLHAGSRTHVWEVRVQNGEQLAGNFICTQVLLEPKQRDAAAATAKSTSEVPPEAVGLEDATRTPELPALELPQGQYATHLGIEVVELDAKRVIGRMPVTERHLHTGKFMHGGVWATFADSIAGFGTIENLREGQTFSTADLKVNVIGAGRAGMTLEAEATPLHTGRRTQVWMVMIRAANRLVAQFTCTQMVLDKDA